MMKINLSKLPDILIAIAMIALLFAFALFFSGCCQPKEGSTRGQAVSYSLIHLFDSDPNPHCEGSSDD